MRNLKALGMALVAALAMSAVAATAASAEDQGHVVVGDAPALVTGTDVTEENGLVFSANDDEIICDRNEFHGKMGSTSTKRLTLATAFGGDHQTCTAADAPATVHNNGCEVSFYTAETDAEDTWDVLTDLHCPEGENGVEVTAFGGSSHGFRVCTITVPPQTGLEGVKIHNIPAVTHNEGEPNEETTPDNLTATVAVKDIHETQSGLCGSSETPEAEMNGEVTVTAEGELTEEPTSIAVQHTEEE